MKLKNCMAFISNGNKLAMSGVNDIVDLEKHDQVIQANECNCNHKEHIASCEIVNVAVDVKVSNNLIETYAVEMAFCKECAAYYIPEKSYEFLSDRGKITHRIKGGVRLFEYMKSGDSFDEEEEKLQHIKSMLNKEYNSLPKVVSRYAIDDGCGGLMDVQSQKYRAKSIYKKQDEIKELIVSPYVGRIDVSEDGKRKVYYIGRVDDRRIGDMIVYSRWSDAGRLFGKTKDPDGNIGGKKHQVDLRRNIDIQAGNLRGVEDVFSSNSEFADKGIYDKFLIQVLMSRKKSHQLTDIIATIQDKQNEIIEKAIVANLIIQGCAGSGKTMVMLHRLSFWLYNYKSLKPEKIKILTPNENFNVHIGGLHSQLNLGAIEIMAVDQYYSLLLDQYDSNLSYHKKVHEEENIEERFLNYIYSKAFVKRMNALYPGIIEKYCTEEDEELVKKYSEICDFKFSIDKNMTDGDKLISFAMIIDSIESKVGSIIKKIENHEEKIKNNITKQEVNNRKKEEDELLIAKYQNNFTTDLSRIIDSILEKENTVKQTLENSLVEVQEEISKKDGFFSNLFNYASIKMAKEKEVDLQKQYNENKQTLLLWEVTRKDIANLKNIEDAVEYFDSNRLLKTKNDAYEYLKKYRNLIKSLKKRNTINETLEIELEKEMSELSKIDNNITKEDYARVVELKNKYPKNISLTVFNELFNQVISEKLVELDMERPDKVYRYELYARVNFAMKLWNKTVGEEELICVDEGQDVSFCEYELIIEQNKKNKAYYNVYGDLNQRIKKGRGLTTWEQLKTKLIAHEYELNENYRNTNQITQYCNEVFNFDMTLTGVEGEPVRIISFKDMLGELAVSRMTSERTAVILPRTMAKTRVTRSTIIKDADEKFSTKFDTSKIDVMYVDEIKGIEFDKVYVVDENLERNERYIAYTRALDKLTIVH